MSQNALSAYIQYVHLAKLNNCKLIKHYFFINNPPHAHLQSVFNIHAKY